MRKDFGSAARQSGTVASHIPMKKSARQSRKQSFDLDPADHNTAGAGDKFGIMGADNDEGLAQLVWKYFGDEITQALHETQQALAPAKGRYRTAKPQKR